MKKRLFVVASCIPAVTFSFTETIGDVVWSYDVQDNKAIVTGAETQSDGLVIPSTLGGYRVDRLGNFAFAGRSGLRWVSIPEGVSLGYTGAFSSCKDLLSVSLPSTLTEISTFTFHSCERLSLITIPNSVTNIATAAFFSCNELANVIIPKNVENIGEKAFASCSSLCSISVHDENKWYSSRQGVLCDKSGMKLICCPAGTAGSFKVPDGVTRICEAAFGWCEKLTTVEIPASVEHLGNSAFFNCTQLRAVYYHSPIPPSCETIYDGCPESLLSYLCWNPSTHTWMNRAWERWNPGEVLPGDEESGGRTNYVYTTVTNVIFVEQHLTITNVTVNYVLNSVKPEFAIPPSEDFGFKNIITEVKSSGCIAVPASWAMNYPSFVGKFGSDFTKALAKKTGKKSDRGDDMFVWHDFITGTDPTNPDDKFVASIVVKDGNIKISYSPELTDEQKSLRVYTVYGKKSLQDSEWVEVKEGEEPRYNFFKVTVELK